MAYKFDKTTGDIIINGFENGIADSMYDGISDCRNINLISVPKEASVNFATGLISNPVVTTGTVSAADAGTYYLTYTGATFLENGMAIYFTAESGLGVSATRTVTDGVTSIGDATITSATMNFQAGDVGSFITGTGIPLNTTISSINSTSSAEMSATATANGTGITFTMETPYYIKNLGGGKFQVASNATLTSVVQVTNGTGTFQIYTMGTPKYFTTGQNLYFMVDSLGQVWTTKYTTTSGYWTYMANYRGQGGTSAGRTGAGLVYYSTSTITNGYLFVFRANRVDYNQILNGVPQGWIYDWKPSAGTINQATTDLKQSYATTNIHEAIVAPDNVVYFTDGVYIGRFFEQTGATFDPTNTATYIYDETRLLPYTDVAQCLSFLGTTLMIGGKLNVIYPWDTTSPTFSYPLLLSEYNIVKLVTVNTNTFIFVGNRGRIYYTNGTNAQLYKKIPDHLSGTIEPYFTWGGATSNKNQLYFSALVTDNGGTALTAYGGLWGIDLDSKAIRLTNKLSYGTYAGYASALTPIFTSAPAGTGLYIGWNSGASACGIDVTIGYPYIHGDAYVDSDLIPIGTYLKPNTNARVEFKLAVPIVNGESVKLQYRQKFSDSFTDISAITLFTYATSTAGGGTGWNGYAGVYQNVPFDNSQWVQIRAILTSTATTPSYVRLTSIILGQ